MNVLQAAEQLLFVNRALLLVLEQEEQAAALRIAQLEAEVGGPGRGHGGRHGAQRHFPAVDCYANCERQGDAAFRTYTRFSQAEFDDLLAELSELISANRRVRMGVDEASGEPRKCKATLQNRLLLALKFLVCGGTCAQLGVFFLLRLLKWLDAHVFSQLQ